MPPVRFETFVNLPHLLPNIGAAWLRKARERQCNDDLQFFLVLQARSRGRWASPTGICGAPRFAIRYSWGSRIQYEDILPCASLR